jgi:hypothetical protein
MPCIVGKHALITLILDKHVNVSGFDPMQGKVKDLYLVSTALTYNCPESGEVIILDIHQGVHVPTMENNLLCPMLMQMNDVKVHECLKFLEERPTNMSHPL